MKKLIAVILLLFLIFVLSGCTSHLDAGNVISKQYDPAHKLYQPMLMIINKQTTIIPRWINIPDRWYITIQSDDVCDTWEVSKNYYEQVEIGDYVSRKKDNNDTE